MHSHWYESHGSLGVFDADHKYRIDQYRRSLWWWVVASKLDANGLVDDDIAPMTFRAVTQPLVLREARTWMAAPIRPPQRDMSLIRHQLRLWWWGDWLLRGLLRSIWKSRAQAGVEWLKENHTIAPWLSLMVTVAALLTAVASVGLTALNIYLVVTK